MATPWHGNSVSRPRILTLLLRVASAPGTRNQQRRRSWRESTATGTVDTRTEQRKCRRSGRGKPSVRRSIELDLTAVRVRPPRRIVVRSRTITGRTRRYVDELHFAAEKIQLAQLPAARRRDDRRVSASASSKCDHSPPRHRSAKRPLRAGNRATRRSRRTGAARPSAASPRRTLAGGVSSIARPANVPAPTTWPRKCSRPSRRSSGCRSAARPGPAAAPRSARRTASSGCAVADRCPCRGAG